MISIIMGVTGSVLSLCCGVLSIPAGVAALATGIIGLTQVRADPLQEGRGLAITGICGGAVALVLPVVLFLLQVGEFWSA